MSMIPKHVRFPVLTVPVNPTVPTKARGGKIAVTHGQKIRRGEKGADKPQDAARVHPSPRAVKANKTKNLPEPVTPVEFDGLMSAMQVNVGAARDIAVAVSGGGDSVALLFLLWGWVQEVTRPPGQARGTTTRKPIRFHVLTVDHGLRAESKSEAKQVAAWVKKMAGATHQILTWRGVKPKTKIAETAREKRYDLLASYCRQHDIRHLFLAHTLDDQAETVLMRLAAGSGLDGLAGMRAVESVKSRMSSPRRRGPIATESDDGRMGPRLRGDDILLMRPLLTVSHDRLLATLTVAGQRWVEDPTNQNQDYARPRLRAARDVLAREGLTPERLAATAARIDRARGVVAWAVDHAWEQVTVTPQRVMIERVIFEAWPPDLQIRILNRAMKVAANKTPRLQQLEALWADLTTTATTRTWRRTLGGAVITRGAKNISITAEK